MGTKIRGITIVNQQGTRAYYVGSEYEGLTLARIEDKSVEYEDALHIIFVGLTADGDRVFEVINAPVDVQYCPA